MKNKSKFIILALIILISIIGISYAFFVYYKVGDNSSKLIFGDIYLKLNSGTDSLTLLNVFPETKEKARAEGRTDNIISFTVSGINSTTNKDIWYEIMLNEGNEVSGRTRFNPEDLVFDLIEVNEDKTETYLVDAQSFGDIKARRIWVETVDRNTTTDVSKTYKLRMWLSEDVFISDTNPNATYDVETFESSYASVKVSVYGDFVEKKIPIGDVIYDLSSLGVPNLTSTPIYEGEVTTITTEVPIVLGYNLVGWSTIQNGEVVYNSGDEIDTSNIINNHITLYPVMKEKEKLVDKITSTMTLTVADSEGTRFVSGNINNNYLWYSGKLWRIVSINSDGSVKLVTQGNMTTIAWNTSSSTNYSTSQIRNWLKNEFLPTLYDAENLLVDYKWDYTLDTTADTTKPSTSSYVVEKVGLLTLYDYVKTGGTTSSSTSKTFLNNSYFGWMMSPRTNGSNVWVINRLGNAVNFSLTNSYGVRPSVNLKSDILISGGMGTRFEPYVIEGDKEIGNTSELLSNRISGEYIKFNNMNYRIVGIETINGQKLTKVTMSSTLRSEAFGSSSSDVNYNTRTGIGKYLYGWYRGTLINIKYRKMIETEITWYMGPTSGTGYNYTKAKTGTTIKTPIGLGYYGEMFSSQFDWSTNIWLMTKYNDSSVWYVQGYGNAIATAPTTIYGVRPSFYLKPDVKITSGTGQYYSPYEISQ